MLFLMKSAMRKLWEKKNPSFKCYEKAMEIWFSVISTSYKIALKTVREGGTHARASRYGKAMRKSKGNPWPQQTPLKNLTSPSPDHESSPRRLLVWKNYGKAMRKLWNNNDATLGIRHPTRQPTSPSPGQRVITHEAAGMKKLWESYEKAMKK